MWWLILLLLILWLLRKEEKKKPTAEPKIEIRKVKGGTVPFASPAEVEAGADYAVVGRVWNKTVIDEEFVEYTFNITVMASLDTDAEGYALYEPISVIPLTAIDDETIGANKFKYYSHSDVIADVLEAMPPELEEFYYGYTTHSNLKFNIPSDYIGYKGKLYFSVTDPETAAEIASAELDLEVIAPPAVPTPAVEIALGLAAVTE